MGTWPGLIRRSGMHGWTGWSPGLLYIISHHQSMSIQARGAQEYADNANEDIKINYKVVCIFRLLTFLIDYRLDDTKNMTYE